MIDAGGALSRILGAVADDCAHVLLRTAVLHSERLDQLFLPLEMVGEVFF